MKRFTRHMAMFIAAAAVLMASGCAAAKKEESFTPRLDKDAKIQLDMIGFFGNFEALDQVMNDFNQYYPNITYSYQQIGGSKVEAYLDANPGVDIFMTSREFLRKKDSTLAGRCIDLSKEEIDLGAIDSQMLSDSCIDGKQLSIPMGQNIYGLVVNTSLLEKEGLTVPENREEFEHALQVLKEKGYTPVQGPADKLYAELTAGMVFSGLCEGEPLREALKKGDEAAAKAALRPAFDLVDLLISNGYTDPDINDAYPEDNYDQAILRFFEGDVPFWMCNTEKVSGMKKRESKSEAFQKEPFSYAFVYPPIGENGSYDYQEPWFGFAAGVSGEHTDYAVEFLRFLATEKEIDQMAEVKGIPSVAANYAAPEIYKNVINEETRKSSIINQGEVTQGMVEKWYTCMQKYAAGGYDSEQEAAEDYLAVCAQELD